MPSTLAVSSPAMTQDGIYFDGVSSARQAVLVSFTHALELRDAAGAQLATWPYHQVRREDSPPNRLRLSCRAADPLARLELLDAALIERCEQLCVNLDKSERSGSMPKIVAWSVAAALSLLLVGWFGIPALAGRIAELVSPSAERRLGDAVDEQLRDLVSGLGSGDLGCEDDALHAQAVPILARVARELSISAREGIEPRIDVLRAPIPNAVALPGGQIYIFSPLLRSLQTGDELVSVLAHEMGHVQHRHGLRRFFEESGLAILFGYMIGDFAGGTLTIMASRFLASASFTRDMEEAADRHAAAFMLQQGRDPAALATALERITPAEEKRTPFAYLQTHPLTQDRAGWLREQSQPATGTPLISEEDWQILTLYCQNRATNDD